MVEALIELDKDHTLRLFVEKDVQHLVLDALKKIVEAK
jgi:hypothetical protein